MSYSKFTLAAGLSILSMAGACESVCAVFPSDSLCQAESYQGFSTKLVQASCTAQQLDTREGLTFSIQVEVTGPASQRPGLAPEDTGVPAVYLQTDDNAEVRIADAQLRRNGDAGLTVTLNPEQLGPGPLRVRVVVSPAELTELQAEADAVCVLSRSPRLAAPHEVILTTSPNGPELNGLVGMQIGTVAGAAPQLLLVEQFIGGMGVDRRWAELYRTNSAGLVERDNSAADWSMSVQKQLLESRLALFAATQEVLLIYDMYLGGDQRQLSMFSLRPPAANRYVILGSADTNLGNERTSLAAAADDQLMLLGGPKGISWFRVAALPTPRYVHLGDTALISGQLALAARAERSKKPRLKSGPYFGVAWNKVTGSGILLKITASEAGKSSDLTAAALDDALQASFTFALTGEQLAAAALGDLNGDGLEDLLVATSEGRLLWSAQKPDGTFIAASLLPATPPPEKVTALAIGDVTADGRADLGIIAGQRAYLYPGL